MRELTVRLIVFTALLLAAFSVQAENSLEGKWDLMSSGSRNVVGNLSADGKYFTISLDEPEANFTARYQPSPSGFRATVIDKNVFVLEGRFTDRRSFDLDITVKEIGKPNTRGWELVAVRK